jgi:hypothetical protein
VTGTPPTPKPLQEQVQAWPEYDHPATLQEYVVKSEPQADCPQAAVTGMNPGPVPVHWHVAASKPTPPSGPGGTPASTGPPQAWPVYPHPAALQEYVVKSEPQADWPQ